MLIEMRGTRESVYLGHNDEFMPSIDMRTDASRRRIDRFGGALTLGENSSQGLSSVLLVRLNNKSQNRSAFLVELIFKLAKVCVGIHV